MATHCSILPGESPWTEEPGGLRSIGSQRVGHDRSDLPCMQVTSILDQKGEEISKFTESMLPATHCVNILPV